MDQSSVSLNARQWSASVLEVDPNCETADLLGRLTDDEYVVSAEWADAMQVLVNPGAPSLPATAIPSATEAGARQRMEMAVTGFANSFFEIPTYRRKDQWWALHGDCRQFPDLTRWLNQLQPALNVERVPQTNDEAIDTFASLCCQSYVARGSEQARRRQALIQMYCRKPAAWQPAVKHLVDHHRDFVTTLVPWLPKLQGIYYGELTKNDPLPVPVPVTTTATAKSEGNWWGWFIAISIVSAILRGIASNHSSAPSNTMMNRPAVTQMDWSVEEARNRQARQLGAKIANQYMFRKYSARNSLDESTNDLSGSADDLPADALKPANQSLPVYSQFE